MGGQALLSWGVNGTRMRFGKKASQRKQCDVFNLVRHAQDLFAERDIDLIDLAAKFPRSQSDQASWEFCHFYCV